MIICEILLFILIFLILGIKIHQSWDSSFNIYYRGFTKLNRSGSAQSSITNINTVNVWNYMLILTNNKVIA